MTPGNDVLGPTDPRYGDVRPLWAEVDLGAITDNVARLRAAAGRRVRMIVAIKANAYGHGVVGVARHLQEIGVDALATANFDEAVAARRAGVSLPILMYGSQLPAGNALVLEHGLTPTVCSAEALESLAALAVSANREVRVHVKVDAGAGRLGVRLDEAAELVRELLARPGLVLEGLYTHISFSAADDEAWSRRRLCRFAELVAAIEAEHRIAIPFTQARASALLARGAVDDLTAISPGHLVYGLSPLAGVAPAELGYRSALAAVKARLIHVGERRAGDDLRGAGAGGAAAGRVGIVLLGRDTGYRAAAPGATARVLCRGRTCDVLAVAAEYATVDLAGVPSARIGDVVTVVGRDGTAARTAEDVAGELGVPSAASWLFGVKSIPYRYLPDTR